MNKKYKLLILSFIILILSTLIITYIYKKNKQSQYDKKVFENISDNIKKQIYDNEYSKTLQTVILENKFIEKYLDSYLKIDYIDRNNFTDDINTLLNKNYKANEINQIFKLSDTQINLILKSDYKNLSDYFKIPNFNFQNYERYEHWRKSHDENLNDIVTYINIGIDLQPYEQTNISKNPDNYLVLVNKFNGIDKDYKPTDLEYITGYYQNKVYIRKDAKIAFESLVTDIKKETGINITVTTAYRDYTFQQTLYDKYVLQDGVEKADMYSARAGFSEHQTGLAIDLKNPKLTNVRLSDEDYTWLKENAYKYGFIIRFPEKKEQLTGYQEENWHIRYVGYEHAKIIHDNNLCLEEYIDLYIKKY